MIKKKKIKLPKAELKELAKWHLLSQCKRLLMSLLLHHDPFWGFPI
jgi:hypothetical protein